MTTKDVLDGVFQDDQPLHAPMKKGGVHKIVKSGLKKQKRINREERSLGSMSLGGLFWYISWHRLFWPHRTFFGWFLLVMTNFAWFWFK